MCKRDITENYVMVVKNSSEHMLSPNEESKENPNESTNEIYLPTLEFDWSYLPAEMIKNTKFVDVRNRANWDLEVGPPKIMK